jgi:hypothetical protein
MIEEGFFMLALLPSIFVVFGGCLRGPRELYAFVTSLLLHVEIKASRAASGEGLADGQQMTHRWLAGHNQLT